MNEILDKARRGGYDALIGTYKEMVLDADFWQALGKACGWPEKIDYEIEVGPADGSYNAFETDWDFTWKRYATVFFRTNLTEGFEKAVEYLFKLIEK